MNATERAAAERYRQERKDRKSIMRRLFGVTKPHAPPPSKRGLSQATFAKVLAVHCANLRVR